MVVAQCIAMCEGGLRVSWSHAYVSSQFNILGAMSRFGKVKVMLSLSHVKIPTFRVLEDRERRRYR